MSTTTRALMPGKLSDFRERVLLLSLLRKDVASNGPAWLPLALVLGAIGAVAYADHLVVSISLVYLYILPLAVGAIFLRKEVSYSLIVICILLHDSYSQRPIHPALRIFDNLSALLCFAFVVYFIQRYIDQREALAKTVQRQRDDLLQDVRLAAQVQRLFLPSGKPAIAGLEIAGMMLPLRGVGGDYYDYIPIDAHTIQVVIADVAGKGVPAALLMAATAAALRLEANHDRNMLQQVVHPSDYLQKKFVNWPRQTLVPATWWFSIPTASLRQKTGLAKNSAWSAFPRWYAAVLHCPPRTSWSISITPQQIFAAITSTMM